MLIWCGVNLGKETVIFGGNFLNSVCLDLQTRAQQHTSPWVFILFKYDLFDFWNSAFNFWFLFIKDSIVFRVHVYAILLRFCQQWFSTLESFSKNQITELGCSLQSLETEEKLILSVLEDRFFKLTNIFSNNILEIFYIL